MGIGNHGHDSLDRIIALTDLLVLAFADFYQFRCLSALCVRMQIQNPDLYRSANVA